MSAAIVWRRVPFVAAGGALRANNQCQQKKSAQRAPRQRRRTSGWRRRPAVADCAPGRAPRSWPTVQVLQAHRVRPRCTRALRQRARRLVRSVSAGGGAAVCVALCAAPAIIGEQVRGLAACLPVSAPAIVATCCAERGMRQAPQARRSVVKVPQIERPASHDVLTCGQVPGCAYSRAVPLPRHSSAYQLALCRVPDFSFLGELP